MSLTANVTTEVTTRHTDPITAIQDKLVINTIEGLVHLGLSIADFTYIEVEVITSVDSYDYYLRINDEIITYTSGVGETTTAIALGIVNAINISGQASKVTAAVILANKFSVVPDAPETKLELFIGDYLDITTNKQDQTVKQVEFYLSVAKQIADNYCNNPFTEDGSLDGTEVDIPVAVKQGVLQMLTDIYADWTASKTTASSGTSISGSTKRLKLKDHEIEYWNASQSTSSSSGTTEPSDIVKFLLSRYRLIWGL